WRGFVLVILIGIAMSGCAAEPPPRNDWYRDALVVLHNDNHSRLLGKGHTVEELTAMVRDIPVAMIQVSAFGAVGTTTYPTDIRPHPQLGDWDTLAAWKQVADRLDRRFSVYINTRGLRISKDHPEWTQRDARGRGKGRHGGLDICLRPSPDGSGALETIFLPMLREIVTRYQPDGIWVDGDHARTPTCYCPNCQAAWKAATGQDEPPTSPEDPDWPRWLAFQQQRFDAYRRQMAELIHACRPSCMYTSNHSWRFRSRDPRCPPAFVDTLSGDLSHGPALRLTRLSAMQLSAEESIPYDIMHNIRFVSGRKPVSARRILQKGGLTLACGAVWNLWVPGASIVQEASQQRAELCAEWVHARAAALGRSTSASQAALLLSETCWRREKTEGEAGFYDPDTVERAALALHDAGFAVDIVNEAILRSRLHAYRTVVVANQRTVSADTLAALDGFARGGGLLVVTGEALSDADAMLGVTRGEVLPGLQRYDVAGRAAATRKATKLRPQDAEVLAAFVSGEPLLTRHTVGRGAVGCLAVPGVPYPDEAAMLGWVMQQLGCGPSVALVGPARDRHLVFGLRRKSGRVILHVTDLTSFVEGRRIVPTRRNDIDSEPPVDGIELRLALPRRPTSIQVVPEATRVDSAWQDGLLALTLDGLDVHAAVILEVETDGALPCLPASEMLAPPPVVFQRIEEGFEAMRPWKEVPEDVGKTRTGGKTSIRVTKETAASGRHSLKFTDSPDAPRSFLPYFFLRPRGLDRGTGVFSFDMRLEADAEVHVELREVENAREFPVGPSFRLSRAGGLQARGRDQALATLPADAWFSVELRFPLGGAGHQYSLTLRVPGREPQTFEGLPYRSRDFWRCGWIGISGVAQKHTAFYADNLLVQRLDDRGRPSQE
ncbi:MAG: hypothetical protein ACODAJ_15805, partial [Planctomycetota bacterium]